MNNDISQLTIRELLSGSSNYVIPIYQRNYAWEEGEITQLIQDIIDNLPEKNRNYYIGTLVVFERERPDGKFETFETIDGQQRLTTLSLISAYLKNNPLGEINFSKELNLYFDSRPNSRNTLAKIFENEHTKLNLDKEEETNTAILNGYHLIEKIFRQKFTENKIEPKHFFDFLFKNVLIMRVKVPKDTDLNHYFEIMNNRGEQLEKHEVLKSRMMETLKDDKESQNCFHSVWEACANMEKYVQMGFTPDQRDAIFGGKDWSRFDVNGFEALREKVAQPTDGLPDGDSEQTLDEIIGQAKVPVKQSQDDVERFNSVINFPNFLLHVLRVQTELDIPLDDKRLIPIFEEHILNKDDAAGKVKKFTFDLLRCKFLYDQYIIKREFIGGTDEWSLKRLKWNDGGATYYVNSFGDEDANGVDNRRILTLLSAFHVSTPTLVYKHWLNAAMHYLFTAETVDLGAYLDHLESVAKSFVFDRFLSTNGRLDYFKIIFTNKGVCQTRKEDISESNNIDSKLSFGEIENNLVFNYLDYLLWVKHQTAADGIVKDYKFTFRSSVEHFYPQNPWPGYNPLSKEILHSFGNLCLISRSKNSRLSNDMPETKKKHYRNNTIDSVKQYLMMKYDNWNEDSINKHFDEMKEVLLDALEESK